MGGAWRGDGRGWEGRWEGRWEGQVRFGGATKTPNVGIGTPWRVVGRQVREGLVTPGPHVTIWAPSNLDLKPQLTGAPPLASPRGAAHPGAPEEEGGAGQAPVSRREGPVLPWPLQGRPGPWAHTQTM